MGYSVVDSTPTSTLPPVIDEAVETVVDHILSRLYQLPVSSHHPHLIDQFRLVLRRLGGAFAVSHPKLWRRKIKRTAAKEINEMAFIIEELTRIICKDGDSGDVRAIEFGAPPVTIIDLCSGMGYLSMFLSHFLPPSRVSRIISVDVLFPSPNDPNYDSVGGYEEEENGDGRHLPTSHLLHPIHPIPIRPRRANLKKGRELRQIIKHCIDKAPGPVIIVGVHLCK